METKTKVTIFHLYRKDGSALFLHPFENLDSFMDITGTSDIAGKYGRDPRVESLTLFRNDLYRMIEGAVKGWLSEQKFISRFLLSAVAFLVVYFASTLLIRDPIPVIDEILLGLAGSGLTFFYLVKKDQNSSQALKKRVELRTKIDRILFEEDPFVKEVEDFLIRNEELPAEKLLDSMMVEESFSIDDKDDARQLLSYLEKRFGSRELKKQSKLISMAYASQNTGKAVKALNHLAESKKIDLSLFATYTRIKRSCEKVS